MRSWDYEAKGLIRRELFSVAKDYEKQRGEKFVARSAIMIPAAECLCVQEALRQGIFTTDTKILAIEREPLVARQIVKKFTELGIKQFVILKEDLKDITSDELDYAADQLDVDREDCDQYFDFAYLDTCGCYTDSVRDAINEIAIFLSPNSIMAATFMLADRSGRTWMHSPRGFKHYKFSDRGDVKHAINSQKIAGTFHKNIFEECSYANLGEYYTLTYARPYKNRKDDAPMITFMFQSPLDSGEASTFKCQNIVTSSGSDASYDLNYV